MSAPSKDDVYAELRRQGIRAIRVDERIAPVVRKGLRGLRKRDWSIIITVAVALIALAVILSTIGNGSPSMAAPQPALENTIQPSQSRAARPRRTTYESNVVEIRLGDRVASARPRHYFDLPTNDLSTIFRHTSEIWLAKFARPGVKIESSELPDDFAEDILDAIEDPIVIFADDPKDVAEFKRIVTGMKDEAAVILGSGKGAGDVADFIKARQDMELSWRLDIERKLREGKVTREEAERGLSAMGLKKCDL